MVQLQKQKPKFDELKIGIVSVIPEKAAEMKEVTGADFVVLNDPEGKVMDYFGLRHQGGNPSNPELDIPQSASFLFDTQGKLVWSHIARNYRVRPKPEEILSTARKFLTAKTGEL